MLSLSHHRLSMLSISIPLKSFCNFGCKYQAIEKKDGIKNDEMKSFYAGGVEDFHCLMLFLFLLNIKICIHFSQNVNNSLSHVRMGTCIAKTHIQIMNYENQCKFI